MQLEDSRIESDHLTGLSLFFLHQGGYAVEYDVATGPGVKESKLKGPLQEQERVEGLAGEHVISLFTSISSSKSLYGLEIMIKVCFPAVKMPHHNARL